MEPVTVIGIIGSVVKISDVVGTSIKKLTELRSAYRSVPFVTTILIGQLYIIQTALDQLASAWESHNFDRQPRHRDLAKQIGPALECFAPLILTLQEKLEKISLSNDIMTIKSKLSFLWNEKEMTQYFTLLDRQVNALNLLVSALQCKTWIEQQQLIDGNEGQATIQLARDCSSSIVGLSDRESLITENTNCISAEFEFDALLSGCGPYLSAQRSHLRQAIRSMYPATDSYILQTEDFEALHLFILRTATRTTSKISLPNQGQL